MADKSNTTSTTGARQRADFSPFDVHSYAGGSSLYSIDYSKGYGGGGYHPSHYPDHKPNWMDSFPHSFTGWGPQAPDYGHDDDQARFHARMRFDDDYLTWRAEQLQRLDDEYIAWRRERQAQFSDDFNAWRGSHSSVSVIGLNEARKAKG
jgi:hypothetical protein